MTGWINYNNLQTYDLSGRDVEFYHDNVRISRDQAARFSNNTNITVYIALEQSFLGNRVRKVTFRDNRDTALAPDTVIAAMGTGYFELLSQPGGINADEGTIIVRHGRLVSQRDIYPGDFASVVLNGDGRAAIVSITAPPDTNRLMFVRGQVHSVEERHAGRIVNIQSQNQIAKGFMFLNGTRWSYTSVSPIYEIDHNTIFWVGNQQYNFETFGNHITDAVEGRDFTFVTEGSRIVFVSDMPFSRGAVRGTIYNVSYNWVDIRNVERQDILTGVWYKNDDVRVNISTSRSFIARENNIINAVNPQTGLVNLSIGDRIVIMTDEIILPPNAAYSTNVLFNPINGWIIRVEN
jgi:hypothetical protein